MDCDDGDPCTIDTCGVGAPLKGKCMNDPLCEQGECCNPPCEACQENGTLDGANAVIEVSPQPACLGDTITFTVSGVVDNGGIMRVDCTSKRAIDPVTPTYTWEITRPDGTTVSGSGSSANGAPKLPGEYSCTFTATANRECEPSPIDVGPVTVTAATTATLSLEPSSIAATADWPDIPPGINQSQITVTWDPPECEGTLEIVELQPQQAGGYLPADEGTLTPQSSTTWRYYSFDEPITALCAGTVEVSIAAKRGSHEYTRRIILVHSVHTFLTTGANADFQTDYSYLRWKYAAVLATTGGAFAGPPTISANECVNCPWWNPLNCVYACTDIENGSVDFGTWTFTGSENAAASIIGHELMHTLGAK